MKLIVLESPFKGADEVERKLNTGYARACLLDCIERGEAPIAFHLLYPQVLDENRQHKRELGLVLSTFWWEIADKHVFYTDRGWSDGMLRAWRWVNSRAARYEFRALSGTPIPPPPLDLAFRKIEEDLHDHPKD